MKLNRASLFAALMAGTLLTITPASQAQDTNTPATAPKREGRPTGPDAMKARYERLGKQLGLSDEQQPKFVTATQEMTQKFIAIRSDASLNNEQKAEKAKTVREETDKKIKELLTAEQYEKFQKMSGLGRRPDGAPGEKKEAKPETK